MIFRYVQRSVFDKRICFNNKIMTQVGPEVLAARYKVMQMHHLGILTFKNLLKQTILATGWTIPGSNPGGRDFPHPSGPALESTQPPVEWVQHLCPRGKESGTWR
jgi:hypothetical protein